MCVEVCPQTKGCLPLENCHKLALFRSALQFLFFKKWSKNSGRSSIKCYGHGLLIARWPCRVQKITVTGCARVKP